MNRIIRNSSSLVWRNELADSIEKKNNQNVKNVGRLMRRDRKISGRSV